MGQVPGPVLLVQNVEEVGRSDAAGRHPGRLYHPDHAQRGRHQGHHRGASGAVLQIFKAPIPGTSAMRRRTASLR